jgi:4'-phosphopantetheinyl transferase
LGYELVWAFVEHHLHPIHTLNLTGWQLPEIQMPVWQPPPAHLVLAGEDTHIWRASLNLPPFALEKLFSVLTADEQLRADRFYRTSDRNRFIAARGILRRLLSGYLKIAPDVVSLDYNPHGKPLLAANSAHSSLHFNLTRRRDLALYAFAIGKPIGIDVELEQSSQNIEELIPQIASAREQAIWEILPDSVKPQAFLHLWTRKEALLKSAGTGFSLPPAQITVFTSSPEIGHNLMPDFDVSWKWVAFTPEAGYLAALTAPAAASLAWFDWRQELDQTTAGSIEI